MRIPAVRYELLSLAFPRPVQWLRPNESLLPRLILPKILVPLFATKSNMA
jgi:hypothetical protein